MPAEEGQPDDQPRVTGQVPPPAPTTGLEQILPGRPPLPHAEEKGAFFVYQRELAPGTRLEQYEIIRVLGSGGFGITYLAKDLFLNRNVVIKENFPSRYSYRDPLTGHIRPNNEHDLENYTWALKSFLSEAQTLAELNNPGIVRILSVFEANGTALLRHGAYYRPFPGLSGGKTSQHRVPVYGRRTQGAADAPAPDSGLSPFPAHLPPGYQTRQHPADGGRHARADRLRSGTACPETSCRHRPDHPGVFLPGTGAGQNEYRPVERSLFRRGHFLRPAYRKSSGPRGSAPGGR